VQKGLISVVMSAFNAEAYLRESIDSILNQTYKNFEFIIVDDCSADSTASILDAYSITDSRIRILKNNKNMGLPFSLNVAIRAAEGEFIARMDADDISLPDRFKKQIDFMNIHSAIKICGTACIEIDSEGKELFRKSMPESNQDIGKIIFKRSPFIHPTVMIRSCFFEEVGFYNESFLKTQDLELWSRAYIAGVKMANLPDFLLLYRLDSNFWRKRTSFLAIRNEIRITKYMIRNTGKFQLYATVLIPKTLFRLSQKALPSFINQRMYNYLRNRLTVL